MSGRIFIETSMTRIETKWDGDAATFPAEALAASVRPSDRYWRLSGVTIRFVNDPLDGSLQYFAGVELIDGRAEWAGRLPQVDAVAIRTSRWRAV